MTATILIVDDTPAGRETLRALLALPDYRLELAASGPEALAQAALSMPDLILLDVMMPGMDGFEVCRRLRADPQLAEVPVIMVTALDDRESRLAGIEAGADDFVSKPFDRAELRARVRTITRLNRYRKLLSERAQFEWVVDQALDGYVLVTPADELVYANAQALRLLGLPPEIDSAIGLPFLPLAQTQYQCEPASAWADWPHQTPIDLLRERWLVRPESPHAPALWLAVTILEAPGGVEARRLIRLRDVTAEINQQQEMWAFHALVSHKLRTPLMALLAGADLLAEHASQLTPAEVAEAAGSVRYGARRLSAQIDDIIRFLEAPGAAGRAGGFEVARLPELIELVRAEVGAAGVRVMLDSALADSRLTLSLNATELIARELLENARKFHPRQQPQIEVSASLLDGGRVRLRFVDDGRWLPTEVLARVWQPYFQVEKYFTGQQPGMGLGLPMVAALVWSTGGQCRLYNRDDAPGVVVEVDVAMAS
jgi:CheY-like chemotaxis protein